MASKEKVIAAVDVGTSKTIVAVGKLDASGQVVLLGCGKANSQGGVIKGEARKIDVVAKAIDEAACEANIEEEIDEVYVSVSGKKFRTIDVEVKREFEEEISIEKSHIQSMLREASEVELKEDECLYHVELQSFQLDSEYFLDVLGVMTSALSASYKVIVGQKSYAKNLDLAVSKSCLRTDRLVLDTIATSESTLSAEEKDAGVVLLDIGASLTRLSIYTEGVLVYYDVFPFAGNILTNDLKTSCSQITSSQAERLKVQYGRVYLDKSKKNTYIALSSINPNKTNEIKFQDLVHILQSRIDELAEWAERAVATSGYADDLRAGVVLTGGTAKLENISMRFNYYLGMNVRVGYPQIKSASLKQYQDPAYASVFGVLQMGLLEAQAGGMLEAGSHSPKAKKKAKRKSAFKQWFGNQVDKISNQVVTQAEMFLTDGDEDEDEEQK